MTLTLDAINRPKASPLTGCSQQESQTRILTQAGRDLGRSLVPAPAQSSLSQRVEPGYSGLHTVGG